MSHFTLVFAANFGPPSYCENMMFFSYKTPQKHTPIVLVKSTSFPTIPTWKGVFAKNELIILQNESNIATFWICMDATFFSNYSLLTIFSLQTQVKLVAIKSDYFSP